MLQLIALRYLSTHPISACRLAATDNMVARDVNNLKWLLCSYNRHEHRSRDYHYYHDYVG